jgi:hypothetical protein
MTHKAPTIEALNAMAKATNDAVRQEAIERGELLPIWKDGRVVLVWPVASERDHALSVGLLVRALMERGVKVTYEDVQCFCWLFGVRQVKADLEIALSDDGTQLDELTSGARFVEQPHLPPNLPVQHVPAWMLKSRNAEDGSYVLRGPRGSINPTAQMIRA